MNKVTVVGSFMYDLVATASRRPKTGETLIGDSFGMFLGGKGANQAIAASRAGASVTMVGRLGNDLFGDQFLEKFSEEGIKTDFVIQDTENGTGVGMPLIDASGDNSIVIIPQANMALTVENIDKAESVIADSDVLVLQCEVPMEANKRAAEIANKNDTLVILNPTLKGSLIPIYDKTGNSSYKRDKKGILITSKLNEAMLTELADAGGGIYSRFNNREAKYKEIMQAIDSMEKRSIQTHIYSEFEDRYQSFAMVSLLLLIAGMVLPTRITKIEPKDDSFE